MKLNIFSTLIFLGVFNFGFCQPSCDSLVGQHIDSKNSTTSSNIYFLNKQQGEISILDESYEPYFSILELREIEIVLGEKPPYSDLARAREFAREKFSSAVTDFTPDEKACITFVINKISEILGKQNLDLFIAQPWRLIKIENWLCGGFAHTRGNYIIISQKHLDKLTVNWKKNMTNEDSKKLINSFGGLLVHEQIHSIQRNYPEKFENLYVNDWGFVKVNIESNSSLRINQLTNPDAPIAEWAFTSRNEAFWIRIIINPESTNPIMGVDFMDNVYHLEKIKNGYHIKTDSLNQPVVSNLIDFQDYKNSFPVTVGLDHPNEISAYMFSTYFISLHNNTQPFHDIHENARSNSIKFINFIKEQLM